jgi:hypothetical protein
MDPEALVAVVVLPDSLEMRHDVAREELGGVARLVGGMSPTWMPQIMFPTRSVLISSSMRWRTVSGLPATM